MSVEYAVVELMLDVELLGCYLNSMTVDLLDRHEQPVEYLELLRLTTSVYHPRSIRGVEVYGGCEFVVVLFVIVNTSSFLKESTKAIKLRPCVVMS